MIATILLSNKINPLRIVFVLFQPINFPAYLTAPSIGKISIRSCVFLKIPKQLCSKSLSRKDSENVSRPLLQILGL